MDKAKKKQLKKVITWVLMAALVAGLAAMPLLAQNEAEADGPVASILSGKVEEGSIRTSLSGGGTLSVEDTENIRIPSGVKITEFLVKNGRISRFELNFRNYTESGETGVLLPVRQAAAAMEAMGLGDKELLVLYRHEGERAVPVWVAASDTPMEEG